MREDPLPDMDPNEKFYAVSLLIHASCYGYYSSCMMILAHTICNLWKLQGDNQNRVSGQALEFKQLNVHAWEAFDKGHDVHMQAAPSQAELLYKNFKINKEKLKSHTKDKIMEKYGNAAAGEVLPRELLLGQSEREVEYDRAGRVIKGQVWTNCASLSLIRCC